MNNFDSNLRQKSVASQIDIISNGTSVLIVSKNHELFTKELASKKCTVDIVETQSDSNNELTFTLDNFKNKKYQTVVLDDTIDNVLEPIEFIKQLKGFLMPEGVLLCAANNLFNSVNRLRFLNGDSQMINSILNNSKNLEFSSLDSILLTLAKSDSSIRKIIRVQEEINLKSKLELNTFTFTEELLEALTSDSESRTFYYVFTITNKPTVNQNTRKWVSKFSKNLVTEGFKQVLSNYKLQYEKHINYLKQTNREQYVSMISLNQYNTSSDEAMVDSAVEKMMSIHQRMKGEQTLPKEELSKDNKKFQKELVTDLLDDSTKFLQRTLQEKDESLRDIENYLQTSLKEKDGYLENALKEKDGYIENALKDKNTYLENSLRDIENYLQTALKDKDEVIHAMQNSLTYRMLSKLDKLLGKKPKEK